MSLPQVAKEFLQQYLPETIKNKINFETLQLQKDTFVDEQYKSYLVDLLYMVEIQGQKGYVYLLFEHLSNPDKIIPFRILKYVIQIMDQHLTQNKSKTLPVVFPIIFYTGSRKYIHSKNIFDLFEDEKQLAKNVYLRPFHFISVHEIDDNELIQSFRLAILIKTFKNSFANAIELVKIITPELMKAEQNEDIKLINVVVKYVSETRNIKNKKEFYDVLLSNLSKNTGEKIMTIAEMFRQEGWQAGLYEKQKSLKQIAASLLREHMSLDKIKMITGLSEKEIKELME